MAKPDGRARMDDEASALHREREQIRSRIGSIGATTTKRRDTVINVALLGIVVSLFVLEIGFHAIPSLVSLEIAVLLVSVKIIMVMTSLRRVSHYEFWILNTIDFRLSQLESSLRALQKDVHRDTVADAGKEPANPGAVAPPAS